MLASQQQEWWNLPNTHSVREELSVKWDPQIRAKHEWMERMWEIHRFTCTDTHLHLLTLNSKSKSPQNGFVVCAINSAAMVQFIQPGKEWMNRVWSFVLQQCSLAYSISQNKYLIEIVLEKIKCSKDVRRYKSRRHKTEDSGWATELRTGNYWTSNSHKK